MKNLIIQINLKCVLKYLRNYQVLNQFFNLVDLFLVALDG